MPEYASRASEHLHFPKDINGIYEFKFQLKQTLTIGVLDYFDM